VTTLTGHTAQTGDAYAVVNHVDYGNAKLVRSTTPANTLNVSETNSVQLEEQLVAHIERAGEAGGRLNKMTEDVGEGDWQYTTFALAAVIGGDGDTLETLSDQLDGIPTVAEFELRTLPAADYVVVTDTLAAVTTVTNLTNAPTNGDLTATMKTSVTTAATAATPTAAAVTGAVGSVTGAVGSVTGNVGGNVVGSVGSVSGDTKQTADVATLIATVGVAGAGLTALATQASVNTIDDFLDTEIAAMKAVLDKLDTTLVLDGAVYDFTAAALAAAPSGGGSLTVEDIVDGVLDELLSGHTIAGSVGAGIAAAGSAGDPWSIPLPGAYTSNQAGKMLSDAKTAIDTKAEPGDPMTIARRP
jgi:hypothetical protein